MIPPDMRAVGTCADGYYGALCSSCMPGYARSDKHGCGKCPSPILNFLRILGLMSIIILAIGILVKNTL